VRSGELAVTSSAQPNGVCVQLGALCLFLVEASWGWLGRDDQLLFPMVTEVEIHEQVSMCAANSCVSSECGGCCVPVLTGDVVYMWAVLRGVGLTPVSSI
jgi:hypothetical protein